MKRLIIVAALLLVFAPKHVRAQTSADSAAVIRAARDYLEGFYEGDADKLRRSVRPNVAKFGLWRPKDKTIFEPDSMSYAEFISYADNFKKNKRTTPATAPREVKIIDLLDHTAVAKVTAWWGTDYLTIAKFGDSWMIQHVL